MPGLPAYQQGLFRHSALLFVATQTNNVATLLFQVLMMRLLSVREYGVLATMLTLVLLVAIPIESLRSVVAHRVALWHRAEAFGLIQRFLMQWAFLLLAAGVLIGGGGTLLSSSAAHLLQLDASVPVILTVWVIALSLFKPYFTGALQGMQVFGWMAFQAQTWGVARLICAFGLSYGMGRTAEMGIVAQGGGMMASVLVGVWAIRRTIPRRTAERAQVPCGALYFGLSLAVLSGYAVLMTADIVLVKIFFEPELAGVFAQAATIGRMVVFLPVPIAAALFPKVVSMGPATANDRRLLWKAMGYTTVLIVSAGLACTILARPIWWGFTGAWPDQTTLSLLRWVVWAMAPLGMTFLLLNFELAQSRFRAPASLLVLAVCYIGLVSVWHESLFHILYILSALNITSLLIMIGDVAATSLRERKRATVRMQR